MLVIITIIHTYAFVTKGTRKLNISKIFGDKKIEHSRHASETENN